MLKQYTILFFYLSIGLPSLATSQEIKTFKISDFNLNGNVKSCLVITDYGKEEYYFDTSGRLTKSITRFNDFDYETTYYKYQNNELVEKRVENYRDNTFDKSISLANFYEIDTSANRKVTEKIVSYTNKKLLEQNVYRYNAKGQLMKMTRTDTDGTDENIISHDTIDGKNTTIKTLNGKPLETVQTWNEELEDGSLLTVKTIEKYFDGALNTKSQEVYNADKKLISKDDSLFDTTNEKWISEENTRYVYGENGFLAKIEINRGNLMIIKDYIYQFDGTENHNWVKEIITPDNTYKTRKITYYEAPKLPNEDR
ncbi:hypothetical protein SAMN05421636_104149 [Pricia antarctica]|uniref:YD repeat-containing protein n=1 Tax=Pricia antarctica TaxID=641691 RepID=A0A1G7BGF7_9FLAO|nr:hypothetical protein [Pricia antarctica]SDE26208.1 hypothetical protein SAMN05421636_104149 [Pricia antarctica]